MGGGRIARAPVRAQKVPGLVGPWLKVLVEARSVANRHKRLHIELWGEPWLRVGCWDLVGSEREVGGG